MVKEKFVTRFIGTTAYTLNIHAINIGHPTRGIILTAFMFLASACTIAPKINNYNNNSELQAISNDYHDTVKSALADKNITWRNGRLGNILVNMDQTQNLGLCYHWQKLVFNGIRPSLEKTGWKATGIAINEGSFMEHHAVLVYDPKRVRHSEILTDSGMKSSYVLDPWESGEARIYTVDNWLKLPMMHTHKARLTLINRTMGDSANAPQPE